MTKSTIDARKRGTVHMGRKCNDKRGNNLAESMYISSQCLLHVYKDGTRVLKMFKYQPMEPEFIYSQTCIKRSLWAKEKVILYMVFNVTFKFISVISWRSVLFVEETGVPGKNQRPAVSQ